MNQGEAEVPEVVENPDEENLVQFVTTIKSPVEQMGEHIIQALGHNGTVAVLTTVVRSPDGSQQVVSAALGPELMDQVQSLLVQAGEERVKEQPCVGFHCLVKPKNSEETKTD